MWRCIKGMEQENDTHIRDSDGKIEDKREKGREGQRQG